MHKQPTVLQVLPSLISGGVERGTIDIAEALVKNGFRSIVVSAGGPLVKLVENTGATHITMPLKSKNPFRILYNIKKLARLIKEERVDIVHARSRAPAWSAYFASKNANCKFVTTFHGTYGMQNTCKKLYNSVMTKGNEVIAVSGFIADYIAKYYPQVNKKHIHTIHRGVDTAIFDPKNTNFERLNGLAKQLNIPDGKFIITMPARLTDWKGHLVLIRALAGLNKKHFHCLIVGDLQNNYNYYNEILELMGKFGLDENVSFSGAIRDMPALYMLSDVVVVASTRPEAFGRIPIEAGAMARIVIATNIGGCKETVINNKTGFLIPPNDHKALTLMLKKAMSLSTAKREEIGTHARKLIMQNFSLDMMIKKTLAVYKKLLR